MINVLYKVSGFNNSTADSFRCKLRSLLVRLARTSSCGDNCSRCTRSSETRGDCEVRVVQWESACAFWHSHVNQSAQLPTA